MPRGRAAAPTPTPVGGSLDQRLSSLAIAVSRKADITTEPTYHAILLTADDGTLWRLTIDSPSGAVRTEEVTP